MNNPEFKRQVWLEWSLNKMILMPVLLGIGFFAVAVAVTTEPIKALSFASLVAFFALIGVWGTRNAQASVSDEFREKTWDQQRMSALKPWAMTWGKLFGATSYAWFGGLICLAVYVVSSLLIGQADALTWALAAVIGMVGIHALVIAINVHLGRSDVRLLNRGGAWPFVFLAVWFSFGPFMMATSQNASRELINWWTIEWSMPGFVLFSSVLFTACALVAAWRTMSESLSVRTLPWAWPGLVAVLAIYFSGFITKDYSARLIFLCVIGSSIGVGMSYVAAFSEGNSLPVWQRVVARWKSGQVKAALQLMPLWPSSLAIAFVFCVLCLAWGSEGGKGEMRFGAALCFTFAFLALRDIALLLFYLWRPSIRKPQGAFIVTMLVLYLLLPFVLGALGLQAIASFVAPFFTPETLGTALGAAIAAVQAALAVTLALWQARKK